MNQLQPQERRVIAPGYARALAGYLRAHAAALEADVRGDMQERSACLEDRYQWQLLMRDERATLLVRHG